MYKVVDLFAGAGGLSLGFSQTKKVKIKVAFENNPNMQLTYKKNHPKVRLMGDVCSADYKKIQEEFGDIDIVIGGPPCQGFSNANRQKNHAISQNNMLVKQYIRAICELQPKAFVMENVSMLRSDVHRFYLDTNDIEIVKKYSIPMQDTKLVLLGEEYIFEGAEQIVKDLKKIEYYLWPEAMYSTINVIYKAVQNSKKSKNSLEKNRKQIEKFNSTIRQDNNDYIFSLDRKAFATLLKYFEGKSTISDVKKAIEPVIMIQRMLSKAKEIFDNKIVVSKYTAEGDLTAIIQSYAVFDYIKAILGSEKNGYVIDADVLNAAEFGAPQKRMRFVVIGIKKSISPIVSLPKGSFKEEQYRTVYDAIGDLESVDPTVNVSEDIGILLENEFETNDLISTLRDSKTLFNHIITDTRDVAMQRFKELKQGENFHSLSDRLKTNTYTDISRTQNTIYQRLAYNKPSGTVVNVRKSMWIHPVLDRAVSIREAARLQTFPDSYVFCGSKDKQYQQVGNAVPPILAKAIAKHLLKYLDKSN